VFGSVARGESWPRGMPIRSDLDLLVVTHSPVPEPTQEELIQATMPLFLECGRQLGPQFRTLESLEHPKDERAATFRANVKRDGISIYHVGTPE
jgi:predicted nucleotidyltransferase